VDDLSVTAVGPLVPDAGPLAWTGAAGTATNGNWDLVSACWSRNGSATNYADGEAVQFDDSAAVTSVTNIATVFPSLVTVTNNATSYTISGSPIAGDGALLKSGSGLLTLMV
jgi:hypothetical protein